MTTPAIFHKLYIFYRDGFKSMTIGKTLWIIVLVKLFIMFFVLKIFFFPNFLKSNFKDDESRSNHVGQELIDKAL